MYITYAPLALTSLILLIVLSLKLSFVLIAITGVSLFSGYVEGLLIDSYYLDIESTVFYFNN